MARGKNAVAISENVFINPGTQLLANNAGSLTRLTSCSLLAIVFQPRVLQLCELILPSKKKSVRGDQELMTVINSNSSRFHDYTQYTERERLVDDEPRSTIGDPTWRHDAHIAL